MKNEFSLINGLLGESLFWLENSYLEKNPIHYKKALTYLNFSLQLEKKSTALLPGLFEGQVGVLFLLNKFMNYLSINNETDDVISQLHSSRKKVVKKQLNYLIQKKGLFELVYGAIGYGISLDHDDDTQKIIINYIKNSLVRCENLANLETSLDTAELFSNELKLSNKVNTGIAHGVTGVFLYLIYLYEVSNDTNLIELISDFKETLVEISMKSLEHIPSYYPDSKAPKQNTWCYGDMGVGFSLMKYAEVFNDEGCMNIGLNRYSKGLRSFSEQESKSNCLCHGRAIVNVFQKVLDRELTDFDRENQEALRNINSEDKSFLSGRIGHELALSDVLSQTNWESIFLLRNPWK